MADIPDVHIGENSPEQVAFKLLGLIATAEKKALHGAGSNADRKWILQTYAQCVKVVKHAWSADTVMKEYPLP